MNTKLIRGAAALSLSLALGACSESLSLDAAGDVAMTLQRAADPQPASPAPQAETQNRSVSPDTVSSFLVTVTEVQVQHASGDSQAGQWETVHLNAPVTIDLMALPGENQQAFVFARGQLDAGAYSRIRLVVQNPTIRFDGAVSFGIGGIAQGDTDYAVVLTGGSPTTIEAAINVDVSADTQSSIALLFDCAQSLSSISLSGAGTILMDAVIEAK